MSNCRNKNLNKQNGLVLFVALIALVVMSLAAVALIRSVDTNNEIAGNLAFKQNAIISSNVGIEAMADTVGAQPVAYGLIDHPADGYYATCKSFDLPVGDPDYVECGGQNLTDDSTWAASGRLANGTGINNGVDQYGNTIKYIVERMSTDDDGDGEIDPSKTLLAAAKDLNFGGNTVKAIGEQGPAKEGKGTPIPIYRITLRIESVKDSVSYVQAYFS